MLVLGVYTFPANFSLDFFLFLFFPDTPDASQILMNIAFSGFSEDFLLQS